MMTLFSIFVNSRVPRLGIDHEQRMEAQLQLLQSQRVRYCAEVVDAFARIVRAEVLRLSEHSHYEIELKHTNAQDALAYRLLSDSLYRTGDDSMQYMNENALTEPYALVLDQLDTQATEIAQQVVSDWRNRLADAPQISPVNYGRSEYQSHIACNPDEAKKADMNELQELASKRFPSSTRDIYEKVRSAVFREMRQEDIPQVVSMYRQALLTSADLENLVSPESGSQEEAYRQIFAFREKMRKGVFIWDLNEEEMETELGDVEAALPLYGRVLESDGDILGWMTYKHMPASIGHQRDRKRSIMSYLHNGVTHRKVAYPDSEMKEELMRDWDKIELFQDIRCKLPLVSSRLAALGFEDMMRMNPHLKHVMAYKLHDLYVDPPLDLLRETKEMGIMPTENDRSYLRFRGWGFKHIAIDFNPNSNAPRSPRAGVGGIDRMLNPKWEIICGIMKDIHERTRAEWRKIQIAHGDFSHDHSRLRSN